MSRLMQEERGASLVIVVIFLPVVILMASFVLDVGNWFEHKRHLQVQADAAALAGAGSFVLPACDDASIATQVAAYDGGTHNAQVGGGQSRVHLRLNQTTYYNQSATSTGTPNSGSPCADKAVDVKLTETDVPAFFRLIGAPFINAHARVSIRAKTTTKGALPIAVPDPNAKVAKAYLFDEATGTTIASATLTQAGTANGMQLWDNATAPAAVPINASDIGVKIALGGGSSTTCGDPLVSCYDANATPVGLTHIRGYAATGGTAPLARDVKLLAGGCSDPYFVTTACSAGIDADVDFGVADPIATYAPTVKAAANGTTVPLAYDTTTKRWSVASGLPLTTGSGPQSVSLTWEATKGTLNGKTCNTKNNNPCKGTIDGAQRAFGAVDARSGPLKLVQVSDAGTGQTFANSFPSCASGCTRNLVVRIGTTGSLGLAASTSDPIVSLRVVGNQNQALDCDPAQSNLSSELANGCGPTFAVNTGQTCPASMSGTPEPWRCVDLQTGHATNQVPSGLNQRILGSTKPKTCTSPNHWSSFPNLPKGDKRIVQVFTTPFGSFQGSGNATVPVTGFATFYVTGWTGQGQGFNNPCQGNGDDTAPDEGTIVGHFIKYVDSLNTGGSDTPCDPSALAPCVAVMTD